MCIFPLCLPLREHVRKYVTSVWFVYLLCVNISFICIFPFICGRLLHMYVPYVYKSPPYMCPLCVCVFSVCMSPPSVFPFHVYVPSVCMSSRCDVYVYFLCISPLCMPPPCICPFYTCVFLYMYVFSKYISTPYVYSFIALFMFSTFWSQI